MTTSAYRESAETPAPKSWWFRVTLWLRGLRTKLFAALRTAASSLWKIVIFAALATVPAICAHLAGYFSWHWIACPAAVAAATFALLEFWAPHGEDEGRTVMACIGGGLAYVVLLVTLGTIAAAKTEHPPPCKDALLDRAYHAECPHKDHAMKIIEKGSDMYLECRCKP